MDSIRTRTRAVSRVVMDLRGSSGNPAAERTPEPVSCLHSRLTPMPSDQGRTPRYADGPAHHPGRRLHRSPLLRQSRGGLRPGRARDPRWMQDVAAEMNLSETAFATRLDGPAQLQPPVVHAEHRGRSLRSCHPGDGARPLGRRFPRSGPTRSVSRPGAACCPPGEARTGSSSTSRASRRDGSHVAPRNGPCCGRPSRPRSASPAATGSMSWSSSTTRRKSRTSGPTSADARNSRSAASS